MWNTSNLLSLARLLLAVPMAFILWQDDRVLTLVVFALAIATDLLDGYLARRLNQISDFGKIIDPLADKVFVSTVAVLLAFMGRIPLWFLLAIVARDAVILAGGIYAQKKTGIVLPSNYVGKVAVVAICLAGTLGFLGEIIWRNYAIALAIVLMTASLVVYGRRWIKVVSESPELPKTVS